MFSAIRMFHSCMIRLLDSDAVSINETLRMSLKLRYFLQDMLPVIGSGALQHAIYSNIRAPSSLVYANYLLQHTGRL